MSYSAAYPEFTLEEIREDLNTGIEYKYIEKDLRWLMERAEAMEKALEAARHELVTMSGLYATDNWKTIPRDMVIHLNEEKVIRKIDRALKPLHRKVKK